MGQRETQNIRCGPRSERKGGEEAYCPADKITILLKELEEGERQKRREQVVKMGMDGRIARCLTAERESEKRPFSFSLTFSPRQRGKRVNGVVNRQPSLVMSLVSCVAHIAFSVSLLHDSCTLLFSLLLVMEGGKERTLLVPSGPERGGDDKGDPSFCSLRCPLSLSLVFQ